MPSFSNGKKESEPGRPVVRHEVVTETSKDIDVNAIAQAVAKALGKMPGRAISSGVEYEDDFSNSNSLEKLADSMIVQRGTNKSNFDELGGTQENKKDSKEVDKTIDLLKGLD